MRVGVIDLRISNLRSICNLLEFSDIKYKIINKDNKLDLCDKYILPGVGSYDVAIELMRLSGIDVFLKDEIKVGKSLLGICLGMQLLFEESEEGKEKGLALFKGKVKKFKNDKLRIPHMGWNNVYGKNFYSDLNNEKFYFAHSYYVECKEENIYAYSDYSIKFPAIVRQNNFYGIQFHPEKSNQNGLELLKKILI